MASFRSWVGSITSLIAFFVLRRFTAGLALPAFAATLYALAFIWAAVLRTPELKRLTPEEAPSQWSALESASATQPAPTTSSTQPTEADNPRVAAAGSPAEPADDAAGANTAGADDSAAEGSEAEAPEEQTPTPEPHFPRTAEPHQAEAPAAETTTSARQLLEASRAAADTEWGCFPAPSPEKEATAEPSAGGDGPAGADRKPARKKKTGSDEWGDESDGSDAEDERRRRAQDELADPEKAQELRQQGNELFKAGKLHDAREAYSEALYLTPSSQEKEKAVLFSNRAACLQKLSRWDDVINDCSEAVKLDKEYLKAYCRRSAAYEAKERWHDALEDLKKAIELEPSLRSKEYKRQAVLEQRSAQQFDKDKTEMMGKLKELGNTVLGKFGMSCDNFAMVQDPETGGYSMSYKA